MIRKKNLKINNSRQEDKNKNILMKKENINNYYTDEDLINFEKLKNFNGSKTNKLNKNQNKSHPIRYANV